MIRLSFFHDSRPAGRGVSLLSDGTPSSSPDAFVLAPDNKKTEVFEHSRAGWIQKLLGLARKTSRQGKYDDAIRLYNQAFRLGAEQDLPVVLDFGNCLEAVDRTEEAKNVYENFLREKANSGVAGRLALIWEKRGEIGKALQLRREIIGGAQKGADYASYVRVYLKWILSRDSDDAPYFSDASIVDFEENVLKVLARKGEVLSLRDGLESFYRSGTFHIHPESEKNFYALFVLKELLDLSVEGEPGSRYGRREMEEKMGRIFYDYSMGDKPVIMNKTKLGVNLYLVVLMETSPTVAVPDDALLAYWHQIGCRRNWIDALKQKFKDGGRP